MKPITSIEYDGRRTLHITGPDKMKSYMTVSPEFAHLMRVALIALGKRSPDTHRFELKDAAPISWFYTAYFGD